MSGILGAALRHSALSRITVFCSPHPVRSFALPHSSRLVALEQAQAERSLIRRVLWCEHLLELESGRIAADVLLCLNGMGRAPAPATHVSLVQQALPFSTEALATLSPSQRIRMAVIRLLMQRSCRSAAKVVVQTPTMAQWVSQAFGLRVGQVSVVLPSVSLPALKANASPALDTMRSTPVGSRLLYVGNTAAYKMVQTLVRGIGLVRKSCPQATLHLTWPTNHPAAREPGVVCLGYLAPQALRQAYEMATAVVMPSLVETVGLPMLEAMSVGTPVLAADRPYAHDICEEAAVFFDPLDANEFAERAIELLRDRRQREDLAGQGRALAAKRNTHDPYLCMIDLALATADGGSVS